MKRVILSIVFAASIFGLQSCATDSVYGPQDMSSQLRGTWSYLATDQYDLSSHGITYTFTESSWTYSIPELGEKRYEYVTQGNKIIATLVQNTFQDQDRLGSEVELTYGFTDNKLEVEFGGHTGRLARSGNEVATN
jgi:hypothetical protein